MNRAARAPRIRAPIGITRADWICFFPRRIYFQDIRWAHARPRTEEIPMLHYSLVFLVFAIVAAFLGFSGLAGMAAGFAKILFFVFLAVWLLTFLLGRRRDLL